MGGPTLVERQRSLGKLTVRERLDLLLDPGHVGRVRAARRPHGSPVSATATSRPTARSPASARSTAGRSRSRAYDFTVMAGSMGAVGENKIARLREHALRQRIPIVWLLDSAGARIQATSGFDVRRARARCSASRSR